MQIQSLQVYDATRGKTLDDILEDLTFGSAAGSITLPDGTIIKWGATGAFGSIGANTTATLSFNFPVAFPTQCDFFHALLTPATTSDFYGVTSLVSKSKTQVQFAVRNGATAQTVASGIFIAIGK